MTEEERFTAYVRDYDPKDPQIALKIHHTWQVVKAANRIAQELDLDDHEKRLVHLGALFHDIGRFEQVRRFHTFIDSISIDHAALGYDILEKEDFLDALNEQDRTLVMNAVRDHSLFALPDYENEPAFQKTISRIIRDADKIDIFRVIARERTEDTSGASKSEIESQQLSGPVRKALKEGRSILRSDRKNGLDVWVSYLGFFADLNYPISWQIVRKQGYWKEPLQEMNFQNESTRLFLEEISARIEDQMNRISLQPEKTGELNSWKKTETTDA